MAKPDLSYGQAVRVLLQSGMSVQEISCECGVARSTVYRWLGEVRENEKYRFYGLRKLPEMHPLFSVREFTPATPCPHNGPIHVGEPFVCMHCHKSGFDHDPRMKPSKKKKTERPKYKFRPKLKVKSCLSVVETRK